MALGRDRQRGSAWGREEENFRLKSHPGTGGRRRGLEGQGGRPPGGVSPASAASPALHFVFCEVTPTGRGLRVSGAPMMMTGRTPAPVPQGCPLRTLLPQPGGDRQVLPPTQLPGAALVFSGGPALTAPSHPTAGSEPGCPRPDHPLPGAQGWGPAQHGMDALHTEWGKAGPPHPAPGGPPDSCSWPRVFLPLAELGAQSWGGEPLRGLGGSGGATGGCLRGAHSQGVRGPGLQSLYVAGGSWVGEPRLASTCPAHCWRFVRLWGVSPRHPQGRVQAQQGPVGGLPLGAPACVIFWLNLTQKLMKH